MGAPDLAAFLAELDRDCLPHVSLNGVIFGARSGRLEVLLMRWFGLDVWGLPAGYVRRDEDLDAAAARMVREQTHLEGVFLTQFHAFGGADRGEPAFADLLRARGIEVPSGHWAFGRVVSIGYVALVDAARALVVPDALADECRWWDVAARPRLAFDHDEMVERGLAALRAQLDELPLGATLLPGEFTMPELQRPLVRSAQLPESDGRSRPGGAPAGAAPEPGQPADQPVPLGGTGGRRGPGARARRRGDSHPAPFGHAARRQRNRVGRLGTSDSERADQLRQCAIAEAGVVLGIE